MQVSSTNANIFGQVSTDRQLYDEIPPNGVNNRAGKLWLYLIRIRDTKHTFFHGAPLSHFPAIHTPSWAQDTMDPVYPAAPLVAPKGYVELQSVPEQQHLLPAAPPSYDQATTIPAETTGPGPAPGPSPAPATTTSTQHTVVVVPGSPYGPEPMDVQCPYCHNFARTRVSFKPNSRTHLIALILCLFQLYCCVCLPYCIASCMSINHYCGMCDRYLGTYDRK